MVLFKLLILFSVYLISASKSYDCEQYLEMEKKAPCGEAGYIMTYGYPYCSKFFAPEYYSWFDESGLEFLHCTRECLIKETGAAVEHESKKKVPDCERIEDTAFDSHSVCYKRCNFCEACKTNKIALLHVFNLGDFLKAKPFNQAFEIATMCGTQCIY